MKTSEAIATFGSTRKLAERLGLSVQAIYKWGEEVPPLRAYQLRELIQQQPHNQPEQHKEAA